MKKWTVMLIPHDRGARQSFNLSALHVWVFSGAFVVLCFLTGYFYQSQRHSNSRTATLEQQYVQMEQRISAPVDNHISAEMRGTLESEIRLEYEARNEALAAELSRIYDLEAEVRLITGLPPREDNTPPLPLDASGGKGGRPDRLGDGASALDSALMRPLEIIYGLSRPPADLILEEMLLRGESLDQLMRAMRAQQERIARTPSIWPTTYTERWISSRFGRRSDPFTKRMRHHDGLDISTRQGTPVVATARGRVSYSGKHRFFGNLVRVDHDNGVETWYGHLSQRLVEEGDPVERGDEIGKVGRTGRATGTHLHYEIQLDGKPINPKRFLGN